MSRVHGTTRSLAALLVVALLQLGATLPPACACAAGRDGHAAAGHDGHAAAGHGGHAATGHDDRARAAGGEPTPPCHGASAAAMRTACGAACCLAAAGQAAALPGAPDPPRSPHRGIAAIGALQPWIAPPFRAGRPTSARQPPLHPTPLRLRSLRL